MGTKVPMMASVALRQNHTIIVTENICIKYKIFYLVFFVCYTSSLLTNETETWGHIRMLITSWSALVSHYCRYVCGVCSINCTLPSGYSVCNISHLFVLKDFLYNGCIPAPFSRNPYSYGGRMSLESVVSPSNNNTLMLLYKKIILLIL